MLKGYRTYIFLGAVALVSILNATGVIPDSLAKELEAFFGSLGGIALRSAIANVAKNI